jgi:phosphopantothenoylcysteine synthetase/decarboxylase
LVINKSYYLKNKKVLITAGPTWVAIDNVRVISNTASGETGILLAEKLKNLGAKVTLLLGPVDRCCIDKKISLIRFKFFHELKNLITNELKSKNYDVVIHSAAVSDYKPAKYCNYKIKSGALNFQLKLAPTQKIINLLKKIRPLALVVGFKFEPKAKKCLLLEKAKCLLNNSRINFVVANSMKNNRYTAYVLGDNQIYGPVSSKTDMANGLISLIGGYLWKN